MVHECDISILRGAWPGEPDPASIAGADASPYTSARRQGYGHAASVEIAARVWGVPFGLLMVGETA